MCLDFHCYRCNTFAHLDADFAYYLQCPTCGQHYAMPSVVTLKPISKPSSPSVQIPSEVSALDEAGWVSEHPVGAVVSYVGDAS